MIRDAVILAAGKGTRLRASEDALPKPLYTVGGVPLIKRTIATLAAAGIGRIVVVTGFMADQIEAALADPILGVQIELAHNADYEKANGISVLVGGMLASGPFVLSMADHIYSSSIAQLVASQDMEAADLYLATDTRITEILDLDDATKVRSEAGRIVDIGKTIATYDRIDCGVFAVTPRLLDALARVRDAKGDCSLSEGVRELASRGRARVADIGDGYWQDVDTAADREHAEKMLRASVPTP